MFAEVVCTFAWYALPVSLALAVFQYVPWAVIIRLPTYKERTRAAKEERDKAAKMESADAILHDYRKEEGLLQFIQAEETTSNLAVLRATMFLNGSAAVAIVAFGASQVESGLSMQFLAEPVLHFFAGTVFGMLSLWLLNLQHNYSLFDQFHILDMHKTSKFFVVVQNGISVLSFVTKVWSATFFVFGGIHFSAGLSGMS